MNIPTLDDEVIAAATGRDVKPYYLSTIFQGNINAKSLEQTKNDESEVTSVESLSDNEISPISVVPTSYKPISRQFWSSGDYAPEQDCQLVSQSGQNRLRVHPKFLHSNATSHKWVFGAIAELLDNAVDEIQNGATFVLIDKITNPRDGSAALLIQDDGGGMGPELLRRCMSFGFSDKQHSSIGQYGNGFKTSTMRLGADVIVFSRCLSNSTLTQSVGLLSYTFLTQTGRDDIVVPIVDFKFNPCTNVFERLLWHGEKEFSANLSTMLKWSPFTTETELLKLFDGIGCHGTMVVVYNLWSNDDGHVELDFESDPKDILISGANNSSQTNSNMKLLHQNHMANRLRYSLRAYSSVLYLHRPENFKVILRRQEVEQHYLVNELKYCECVMYKPQVEGRKQGEVITTIGYLKDAPVVNIHGFNIYHKNRLILPFASVVSSASSKGRGVVGVLEANFIKPTHDKQGFERSTLYQKLESRLKEMTNEYWDTHCDLLGYYKKQLSTSQPLPSSSPPKMPRSSYIEIQALVSIPSCSKPAGLAPSYNASSLAGKRKENPIAAMQPSKRLVLTGEATTGLGTNPRRELGREVRERPPQNVCLIVEMNRKLRAECSEKEQTEKTLKLKEQKLREELEDVQRLIDSLLSEFKSTGSVCKVEKR